MARVPGTAGCRRGLAAQGLPTVAAAFKLKLPVTLAVAKGCHGHPGQAASHGQAAAAAAGGSLRPARGRGPTAGVTVIVTAAVAGLRRRLSSLSSLLMAVMTHDLCCCQTRTNSGGPASPPCCHCDSAGKAGTPDLFRVGLIPQ